MAYTNIDDPSAYFQTKVYTGTNANQSITNDGNSDLQPDLIFASYRTLPPYTNHRAIIDSSRGRAKILESDTTAAEATTTNAAYDLVSFDTDGFTVGAVNSTSALNASGISNVAWQWKANGGTTSTNTDGAVTSTVQVNSDAGFSIVSWTGTGSATTLGHGLGVAPKMLIVKNRSRALDWAVYHTGLTDAGYVIALNSGDAQVDSGTNRWNHTDPTSSVFSVGAGQQTNQSGDSLIAYCFAEKQGYSKFGKYVGNGNVNGPFVYTGFKPAFVMIKNASATESWVIYDTKRNLYNVADLKLSPDTNDSENGNAGIGGAAYNNIDILSNGFKCRTNNAATNGSGNTIIYMAFAESPFTTSTGVPTTAR